MFQHRPHVTTCREQRLAFPLKPRSRQSVPDNETPILQHGTAAVLLCSFETFGLVIGPAFKSILQKYTEFALGHHTAIYSASAACFTSLPSVSTSSILKTYLFCYSDIATATMLLFSFFRLAREQDTENMDDKTRH